MADQESLIEQFVGVTGVDHDRARFHLESAAWSLEVAMASFYEDDGTEEIVNIEEEEIEENIPVPTSENKPRRSRGQNTGGSSKFATIASMRPEEGSSSDDDGQAFYAGGSERSGQQIIGPRKKKTNPSEMVETLFKSAKEHGAEVVDTSETPTRRVAPSFKGTGYRLGDTEGTSDQVQGTHVDGPKQVDIVLQLWKGGFSVDNGPQRDYKDPANQEFLKSISKGEIPRELIRQARGGEVNLNMEDHRNEDFVKPKVSVAAFTGAGRMLGSPAPNIASVPPEGAGASAIETTGAAQQASVSLDDSKPSTSIQIRLADGSRLVAKFNHSHQISDIRNYILSSRPQYVGSNFILMTTFPNKELSNESLTIQEANLMNAVIVQRQK